MVVTPKVENFFLELNWRSVCMPFGDGRTIYLPSRTMLPIAFPPSVKAASTNYKIPTGFSNMPCFFGVLKNTQFTLYLELFLVHEHLHNPKI
jgi:hypothetical protein